MKMSKPFFDSSAISTRVAECIKYDLWADSAVAVDPRSRDDFRKRQNEATLSKFEGKAEKDSLERACFDKFRLTNQRIGTFGAFISSYTRSGVNDTTRLGYILRRARDICAWTLASPDVEEVLLACRNSGGVSIGVPFSDTSNESKFSFPISTTRAASSTFLQALWSDDELTRYLASRDNASNEAMFDYVGESKATTVPKSMTKRRMIAIEPTANMYLQQGLMRVMYKRLADVGLDVTSLPRRHTSLAYAGSVGGHLSTIDLSSASDCVSLSLVQYLFPKDWLAWLLSVRVPYMSLNGERVKLECYATMGNATTFPTETLVFWSLAVACNMFHVTRAAHRNSPLKSLNRKSQPFERDSITVFGDDCIVPSEISMLFIETLEELGFIINEEKSFYDGEAGFRESCGGDYYHGRNVRPFYLRAPTSESRSALEPWLYTLANGVISRYITYFGHLSYVYDKEIFRYLCDLFRRYKLKIKLVPSDYPDDSGIKTPDSRRLLTHYRFPVSGLEVNEHGSVRFTYCRFKYWQNVERHDHLHYALWKRKLHGVFGAKSSFEEPSLEFPIRSRGGYYVASAVDPCFGINRL